MSAVVQEPNYKKFSNRVCNLKEAGFIGIGFLVAVVALLAIILGIYFGTKCAEDQYACSDGYTCVKKSEWCDGKRNCPVGEDESLCYPSSFYVSFKTDEHVTDMEPWSVKNLTYQSFCDCGQTKCSLPECREAAETTLPSFQVHDSIHHLNSSVAVEFLRFRKVNGSSINLNATDETLEGFLAVDSFVSFQPFGSVCDKRGSEVVYENNITDALGGIKEVPLPEGRYFATISPPGPGVTTGAGVVLEAKSSNDCRRPKVYCATYCRAYKFSTKGCPSYPCTCLSKDELKTACETIGKDVTDDTSPLAK